MAYTSDWLNKMTAQCDLDSDCAFTLTSPLPNGAYNWFVQVRDTIEGETYQKRTPDFANFKLRFPDRAMLQSPINTVMTSPTPFFTWGEVTNATEYRVVVRDVATRQAVYNSGWQGVICIGGICEMMSTQSLPNGDYEWRVATRNIAESPSIVWSTWKHFTVKSPGEAFNLAGDITNMVTWEAANSATEYRVQIQRIPANRAVYTSDWLTCIDLTCTHTPGVALASRNYRWRVQARNANGISNSAWVTQSVP